MRRHRVRVTSPGRLLAMFALSVATGLSARTDGDIEWRHGATQGAVTLTANPLATSARTSFYTARGFFRSGHPAAAQFVSDVQMAFHSRSNCHPGAGTEKDMS